jgi:Ca2+-binding RTX toxin-like protein
MAVIIGDDNPNTLNGTPGDDEIFGLGGGDLLQGFGGDDSLYGGDGNDLLNGNLGNDLLDGGAGGGTAAFYDGPNTVGPGVTVSFALMGQAQNTGQGFDTLINIDTLYGTRRGDTLIGDEHSQGFIGAGGPDLIQAGGGDDLIVLSGTGATVDGGAGQDLLRFWHSTNPALPEETAGPVNVSLALQGGPQDTGQGVLTLTGVEHLSGSRYGDTLTGDEQVNHIGGSLGDDRIEGGGGDDSLMGDAHFFVVQGGWVGDSAGNDTLVGGDGNDTLLGGSGNDLLSGGDGADVFVFRAITEGADLIADLDKHHRKGDVIDLSAIDADATLAGDQAFVLAKKGLTGQAGEAALVYDKDTGLTSLMLDLDGDAVADHTIFIAGKFENFDNFVL